MGLIKLNKQCFKSKNKNFRICTMKIRNSFKTFRAWNIRISLIYILFIPCTALQVLYKATFSWGVKNMESSLANTTTSVRSNKSCTQYGMTKYWVWLKCYKIDPKKLQTKPLKILWEERTKIYINTINEKHKNYFNYFSVKCLIPQIIWS